MTNSNLHTILYVDDEQENLTGFKYVFRRHYNICLALSAKEGRKILKSQEIKVILCDQRMPGKTGVEFLEEVVKKYPDIYRIIVTGYTDAQDIIEAINRGKVFQFIRKPWDKDEVKMIIDNAIRLYDLRKENQALLKSLEASKVDLEKANAVLEEKVKVRTHEIEEKNRELEEHKHHLEELVDKRTAQLKKAKLKAEESDRLKTSFLANVSHEIRTPMNAIIGFSELLINDDLKANDKHEFKEQIVLNSNSLLRLIDDILDISQIEANQLTIRYDEYDLNQLLRELNTIYNRQKSEQRKEHVELNLELGSDGDIHILIDKIRLHQVISNLVGNAMKFTEKGTIRFGYKIVNNPEGEEKLQFFVSDTGIGIPEDEIDVIFDRFRKAKDSKNKLFRGAGLGLFICKSIIEKLSGRIWLDTSTEKGACFKFEIPYLPVNGNQGEHSELDGKVYENFDFSGKLILVAEDEDACYSLIKKTLNKTNAKLIRAQNGQETLNELANNIEVDLVLLDMKMPVMDGYKALAKIKKKYPGLPVIVQTANALAEQRQEILKLGCQSFLAKPFKSVELLTAIKNNLK